MYVCLNSPPPFHRPDYTHRRTGIVQNEEMEGMAELNEKMIDRQTGKQKGWRGGTRLDEPDSIWLYYVFIVTLLIFLVMSFCRFLSSSRDDDEDEDDKDK